MMHRLCKINDFVCPVKVSRNLLHAHYNKLIDLSVFFCHADSDDDLLSKLEMNNNYEFLCTFGET